MIAEDPIQGVSWRNTKRHYNKKKKATCVGPDGPRLPDFTWTYGLPIDPEAHVHPRRNRTHKCDCGYPATRCTLLDDDGRNYCFLNEEKINANSSGSR